MSADAAPSAQMPAEADNTVTVPAVEQTDEEAMYSLFVNDAQVDETEEVVRETIQQPSKFKITKPWKLQKCPDAALQKFLPMDGFFEHYLVAVHVRDTMLEWERQQNQQAPVQSGQTDVAVEAVRLMTQEMERQRKQRKRNRDSDSEDETVKDYNCSQSLKKYGLSGIPNTRMPKVDYMEKTCQGSKYCVQGEGRFLIQGTSYRICTAVD